MNALLVLHPDDNVAVAVRAIAASDVISVDGTTFTSATDVPAGHKVARVAIAMGTPVIKYGFPIGRATVDIAAGSWVHEHNLRTALSGASTEPPTVARAATPGAATTNGAMPTFMGFRRASGRVGTRNEIWIINTVGCVNHAAEKIAAQARQRFDGMVDGVYAFSHPYGCSQLGDDLSHTRQILAGLMRHPNAGGVLVLGLGCENNQLDALLNAAEGIDRSRVRYFNTQEVADEIEEGVEAVAELVAILIRDSRTVCQVSDLLLGMKCGGSDGLSGVSANPLVGRIADRLTSLGGGVLLTEVPEMFGAEQVLASRAATPAVRDEVLTMVSDFKEYFTSHGQPVSENPSPGNKAGGLTTLEEKSLGAIQKGGSATVSAVRRYGAQAPSHGLTLLEAPGNDGVSSTAMIASGATVLLFTTGRGTPLGFPVPTIKISSNSAIAERKPHWIDFNAGELLDGAATMNELTDRLFARVLDIASGKTRANNELNGNREIAIWKDGVTL